MYGDEAAVRRVKCALKVSNLFVFWSAVAANREVDVFEVISDVAIAIPGGNKGRRSTETGVDPTH